MEHLGLSFPVDLKFPVSYYTTGPKSRGFHRSSIGVHPALERLAAPRECRLLHLATWTEDFLASRKGMPYDEFAQFYEVYAKLNPHRARVPPDCLEEFKQRRAADCPIWQVEQARACAPEACDVVPPPPPDPLAPSPPSESPSEPADSAAKVRAANQVINDPAARPAGLPVPPGSPPPSPPPAPPGGSDDEALLAPSDEEAGPPPSDDEVLLPPSDEEAGLPPSRESGEGPITRAKRQRSAAAVAAPSKKSQEAAARAAAPLATERSGPLGSFNVFTEKPNLAAPTWLCGTIETSSGAASVSMAMVRATSATPSTPSSWLCTPPARPTNTYRS